MKLQRHPMRQWNGNFAGFLGILLKTVKNYSMKHNMHFSGKWQHRQKIQFTRYWGILGHHALYLRNIGQ